MNALLEKNLSALAKTDEVLAQKLHVANVPPDFVVASAKNGLATLIIRGVSLHSRIDPAGEAEAMLEAVKGKAGSPAVPIALFGLGLGYHALALARGFEQVMVIEHNLGLIRLAFSLLDFREALPKLSFQTQGAAFAPPPDMLFVPHTASARIFPREYEYWRRVFSQKETLNPDVGVQCSRTTGFSVPGFKDLIQGMDQSDRIDLSALANAATIGRGALSPAEIYILLLKELTTGG